MEVVGKCKPCDGTGWSLTEYMEACSVCHGSGTTHPSVFDYNELIPPENPAYPWKADDWQLLCYYCAQPIEIGKPVAGYRQRTIFMKGMWRHKEGNLNCVKSLIRPDIDPPRCHICGTQTTTHGLVCSAAGKPACHAIPMSAKEDELIRRFGWNAKEKAQEKQAQNTLATVGAFVVTAGLVAAVSFLANIFGGKKNRS